MLFLRLKFLLVGVLMLFSVSLQASGWVISANTVQGLAGNLSSVSPSVATPFNVEAYLSEASALGYSGPLGPTGPLGMLGPIGQNTWNPSSWVSGFGDWDEWSNENVSVNGALGEEGSLGPYGPLSELAYDVDLPAINDFCKQLQLGGVWTALGPAGPLGALGPLGPLGPLGAHQFEQSEYGQYLDAGEEVRQVIVDYDGEYRRYELYENYSENYAKASVDNDTSFMVEGSVEWPYTETDTYEIVSAENQSLTIVLSPEVTMDDFDLVITDEHDQVIATSNTYTFIDFIQLNNIAAGTRLNVSVNLYSSFHYWGKNYRLFVTGSTPYLETQNPISGDHQVLIVQGPSQ